MKKIAAPQKLFPSRFGLTLGVIAIGTDGLVIAPLLDTISTALNVAPVQVGWTVSVYGLTLAVVAPLIALSQHRVPRRTTMTAGLGVFVLAALLCASASQFWMLLVARALCGAAAGAFLPTCYAYVGDTNAYAHRSRAMGKVMAGWSVALMLGVPLGSAIAQWPGWRAAFVSISALGCVAMWAVNRLPTAPPAVSAPGSSSATDLLANGVPLLLGVSFFNVLSFHGSYTFLGVAVRERLGMGSAMFGLIVSCYGAGLLFSTLNARLMDLWGKERTLTIGLSALVFQLALLAPATAHGWALALAMLLWGVSQGFVQTATATLVTHASGSARGLATAAMSCGSYLAVARGSLAGGWLLERRGFAALCLACAAATLSALLLLRRYVARNDARTG